VDPTSLVPGKSELILELASGTPFFRRFGEQVRSERAALRDGDPLEIVRQGDQVLAVVQAGAGLPTSGQKRGRSPWSRFRSDRQLESLVAVDELVVEIWEALDAAGVLDDTLIIFTSDHGYSLGQHRFGPGKLLPYEEIIRAPLLIRGPGFPSGLVSDRPAANIDLAPTILAAAGASPSVAVDGVPLQSVIDNEDFADRAVLLQRPDLPPPSPEFPAYVGIRVPGWKYIEYVTGDLELYDLTEDPYELDNLAGIAAHGEQQQRLAEALDALVGCTGTACSEVRVDGG
jgi:hypothetical protein